MSHLVEDVIYLILLMHVQNVYVNSF